MTVPSNAVFQDCINQLEGLGIDPAALISYELFDLEPGDLPETSADPDRQLFRRAKKELFLNGDESECLDVVKRIRARLMEKATIAFGHDAFLWLDGQSAYTRADRRIRSHFYRGPADKPPKIFTIGDDIDVQREVDGLRRAAAGKHTFSFKSRLTEAITGARFLYTDWQIGFLKALAEFHYSEAAAETMQNRKRTSDDVQTAIAGLKALHRLGNDTFATALFAKMPSRARRPAFSNLDSARTGSTLEALIEMSKIDPDLVYPLARLDETGRERVFVYRMARLNWRRWRVWKTGVISDLMLLEGFPIQLDERTVVRQCAAIKRRDRQLLAAISELTAASEKA